MYACNTKHADLKKLRLATHRSVTAPCPFAPFPRSSFRNSVLGLDRGSSCSPISRYGLTDWPLNLRSIHASCFNQIIYPRIRLGLAYCRGLERTTCSAFGWVKKPESHLKRRHHGTSNDFFQCADGCWNPGAGASPCRSPGKTLAEM